MSAPLDPIFQINRQNTKYPEALKRLKWVEGFLQLMGVAGTIIQHGLHNLTKLVQWELGIAVVLSMLALSAILALRYKWSLAKPSFYRRHRSLVIISAVWALGTIGILIFGPLVRDASGDELSRPYAILLLSEGCLALRAVFSFFRLTRRTTGHKGLNPALIFVGSFVILILMGTILLMLPKSYADPAALEEPFLTRLRIAMFTSTSASCVTGLYLVDTGGPHPYWSRMGQTVIMGLIQFGGLGIMTCGAFFAVMSGRAMQLRESATLNEMLEAEDLDKVRRLILGIFGFTLGAELLGAVLLSGLWSHLPFSERVFYSVFHSVSAFCNAGFTLTANSFVGMATRWQIWAVVPALIIIGGLGFAVLYNVAIVLLSYFHSLRKRPLFNLSSVRTRLSIFSRVVLVTSACLLVVGAVCYYVLESTAAPNELSAVDVNALAESPAQGERVANAWFQSVTFRTAGFNSVDHGALKPATKLLAIVLMFIGAAPGSTGGGVKVVVFALAVLRLVTILQGRKRIEVGNRVIAEETVSRALTVLALGVLVIMTTTMLLVIFENNESRFLDHLFEATSAFATVGVSSITTSSLKPPSQIVIMVTMFLGRVGPLTVMIGLAGHIKDPNYDYPEERVTLG